MLQQLESKGNRIVNKQIEMRKVGQQNINIEPYRSHRKRQSQLAALQPLVNQSNNLPEGTRFKLSRDYPSDPLFLNSTQKAQRFSYTIAKENDFPAQYQHSYEKSSFRKSQNSHKIQDIQASNRNKQIYMQSPFYIGNLSEKKEIKSIMLGSKIQPFDSKMSSVTIQEIQIGNNRQINTFKLKVEKVNNEIEAGISNLQRLIEKLKSKKREHKQLAMSIKKSQQKSSLPIQVEKVQDEEVLAQVKINNHCKNPTNSKIPENNKQERKLSIKANKFSSEYTTLINRLATQIEIDVDFTNNVSNLCRNSSIEAVKALVVKQLKRNAQVDLDESFFMIEQSEIDPLQIVKPQQKTDIRIQQITQLSMQLYRKYKEIQHHFVSKLKQSFQANIIRLLFEQIELFTSRNINKEEFKAVTIGHLLSYINMRANKTFRNRSFVKMAKRIGIKQNANLTPAVLQVFIKII